MHTEIRLDYIKKQRDAIKTFADLSVDYFANLENLEHTQEEYDAALNTTMRLGLLLAAIDEEISALQGCAKDQDPVDALF